MVPDPSTPPADQDTTLATLLPQVTPDIWAKIFEYLDPDEAKALRSVSKPLLAAWRAGVVGLQMDIPPNHELAFLLDERFAAYPNLRFVKLGSPDPYALDADVETGGSDQATALALPRPRISLHPRLSQGVNLPELGNALKSTPGVARLVTHLSLTTELVDGAVIGFLSTMPHLLSLRLDDCLDLPDEALRQLIAWPGLRHLALFNCHEFSADGLSGLADPGCTVRSLWIQNDEVEDDILCTIARARQLSGLMLTSSSRELTADALGQLNQLKQLRRLSLRQHRWLRDEHIRQLAPLLKQLEWLDLAACPKVKDPTLQALAGMPLLTHLNLGCYYPNVSLKGLQTLASSLPALRTVAISMPDFGDDGPTPDMLTETSTVTNKHGQAVQLTYTDKVL